MTLDIVQHLLEYSEDSEQLAKQFTMKVRELTGAKVVGLIQFPEDNGPYSLLGISPARRAEEIMTAEMRRIFERARGIVKITTWNSTDHLGDDYIYLEQQHYSINLLGPLVSGNQQIGCLLALGLVEERSLDFLINVFNVLLGIAALVFRNSSLIKNQESVIKERTQALAKAKEKAEMASQAKSEFLANVSHEIRTPLNAVNGFTELLSSMIVAPKQKSYLSAIKAASNNLLVLINDILDLSKIEVGQLQIAHAPVDIREIAVELQEIFQLPLQDKGLELEVHVDETVPAYFFGDENRLRQILLNLVGNALKFTDTGFIKLSVHTCNKQRGKETLQIVVEDSGIGIAQENITVIFQPFKQIDGKSTRRRQGTGLGLSICKHLVEAMHGELHVSSSPNVGSIFRVTLPGVRSCPASTCAQEAPAQTTLLDSSFKGKKVLAVDDDAINRMLLKEILTNHSVEVMLAENGKEALELLVCENFDLVILDIQMPVMDGFETVKRIRANSSTQHIPVIGLTASMWSEVEKNDLLHKFSGCLSKPIGKEDLMNAIVEHL